MASWLKSWIGPLLLILFAALCGMWWIFLFTETKTVPVTISRKNLPDTIYYVVPSYTKYFLHENGDTTYLFYDINKKVVLKYPTNVLVK